jgi:hypothetical protein
VHRPGAVDDEYPAVAGFSEHLLQQGIVLEAPDRGDPADELPTLSELRELEVAAAYLLADLVHEVGGGYEGDLTHAPQPNDSYLPSGNHR